MPDIPTYAICFRMAVCVLLGLVRSSCHRIWRHSLGCCQFKSGPRTVCWKPLHSYRHPKTPRRQTEIDSNSWLISAPNGEQQVGVGILSRGALRRSCSKCRPMMYGGAALRLQERCLLRFSQKLETSKDHSPGSHIAQNRSYLYILGLKEHVVFILGANHDLRTLPSFRAIGRSRFVNAAARSTAPSFWNLGRRPMSTRPGWIKGSTVMGKGPIYLADPNSTHTGSSNPNRKVLGLR